MAQHINKYIIFLVLFLISCGENNRATQSTVPTPVVIYTPGDLVSDGQGYIQYRVGNTPVIITVPHDGTLVPSNMADRMGDTERAVNTRKVAEQFAVFFNANSNGLFPHIIYNNLSRTKLDPDANLMDGAQGNSYANQSYGTYHSYLQTAIDSVEANFDAGLLLNLVEHNEGGFDVLDGPNAGASAAVGCQCLPGLAPNNEQDRDRDAFSVYVDAEADVRDNLLVNVALRTENYSDFGQTTNGKIAMRYELQDGVAARGSFSTGFRAPALQEAYFSSIATNFIDGIPYEVGTFPVDTEPARALGAKDLEPETSTNLSAGMTYKDDTFTVSVDAYQIKVDDRITMSETFNGSGATSDMATFFADRGIPAVGGRYFFNGINTETNGLDIVATMTQDLSNGSLLLKAAMNFNDTEVTNKGDLVTPAALADYTTDQLLGRANTVRFESSSPAEAFQFSARVQRPTTTWMVKLNRWGEVTIPSGSVEREQVLSGKWTTDMEYSFQANSQVRVSFGVNNMFDVYPDKTIKRNSFNGIFQHSGYSPFGFNGRYVYTRLDMTL